MLSIDITDRQIKLVRGVHSGNKIRVQDADMRELTLGMVSNGYITDVPMVAAELNDIIKTKGITEKDAIVSITSSSIVYKEMLLPKPKSLKNTAAIEAMIQANMGVSKEFNISFTIAGETEDELVASLVQEIRDLNDKLDIPQGIKNYGKGGVKADESIIDYAEFEAKKADVAANAILDACTGSNPRQPTQEEMEKLLECVYNDQDVDF